jgi:hypothetical protein
VGSPQAAPTLVDQVCPQAAHLAGAGRAKSIGPRATTAAMPLKATIQRVVRVFTFLLDVFM